ncbi:hypothetical protein AGMMS4956_12140 [Bacteroidia bacterium]|nr:hypothetical protein AGMMS4956_12140 [Bacteroidia bacterium]
MTNYVQTQNDYPPLIHDLRRIGEKAGLVFDEQHRIMADTISRFNIRARYDDYKKNFYKLCSRDFTIEWFENIKTMQQWINTMLLKLEKIT